MVAECTMRRTASHCVLSIIVAGQRNKGAHMVKGRGGSDLCGGPSGTHALLSIVPDGDFDSEKWPGAEISESS